MNQTVLSEKERLFLKNYSKKSLHSFKEILRYCTILDKLTK